VKPKGFMIFHLNLAFSSLDESAWLDVIKSCYHPLLDMIEQTGIQIGIELTGWTLKQIKSTDISWVNRFKSLLDEKKCVLIGSGYCQIIGPIVPHTVNEWNQRLGLESYEEILSCKPNIILVNEMAFSSSLVNLYKDFGYSGIIMDRDNIRLSLDLESLPVTDMPSHAKGLGNVSLPVLWSDSILFQKVQHYTHGDISIDTYLDYLKSRVKNDEIIFPIYTNDAEVFDYRPGRFVEERPTHPEGEWIRFKKLLDAISNTTNIEFCSPTNALKFSQIHFRKNVSSLTNAAYPIPVKKQAKYNIARWAVTGRNDFWINTMCHRIEKHFKQIENDSSQDWRELCELWSSDLRTHITDKRWTKANNQLSALLKKNKIANNLDIRSVEIKRKVSLEEAIGSYGNSTINIDEEKILLSISTKNISLILNLRRGLTIHSLAFSSHDKIPCLGTLQHGHFSSISLGADFYSGGVVVELPTQRKRVTDLEKVKPKFRIKSNGMLEISAKINTQFGNINKIVNISTSQEEIYLDYEFLDFDKIIGSVRIGALTLFDPFNQRDTVFSCHNGGKSKEAFNFDGEFDHSKPASPLVSSSRGLGATTGEIEIINNSNVINISWDPSNSAVLPMLQNNSCNNKRLSRIMFSLREIDDTVKYPTKLEKFTFCIKVPQQ
jgi:hypothetical protein